jgi:hypothetical protein
MNATALDTRTEMQPVLHALGLVAQNPAASTGANDWKDGLCSDIYQLGFVKGNALTVQRF